MENILNSVKHILETEINTNNCQPIHLTKTTLLRETLHLNNTDIAKLVNTISIKHNVKTNEDLRIADIRTVYDVCNFVCLKSNIYTIALGMKQYQR